MGVGGGRGGVYRGNGGCWGGEHGKGVSFLQQFPKNNNKMVISHL